MYQGRLRYSKGLAESRTSMRTSRTPSAAIIATVITATTANAAKYIQDCIRW